MTPINAYQHDTVVYLVKNGEAEVSLCTGLDQDNRQYCTPRGWRLVRIASVVGIPMLSISTCKETSRVTGAWSAWTNTELG